MWKSDDNNNTDLVGSEVKVGDLKRGDDTNNFASAVSKRKIVEQWHQSEPCKKSKCNISSPSSQEKLSKTAENCHVGFAKSENDVALFSISEQTNNCDEENTCTNNFMLARCNPPMDEFCETNHAGEVKETKNNSCNDCLSMSPVYDLKLKETFCT